MEFVKHIRRKLVASIFIMSVKNSIKTWKTCLKVQYAWNNRTSFKVQDQHGQGSPPAHLFAALLWIWIPIAYFLKGMCLCACPCVHVHLCVWYGLCVHFELSGFEFLRSTFWKACVCVCMCSHVCGWVCGCVCVCAFYIKHTSVVWFE